MHYVAENWGKIGEGEPGHHQNLISGSLGQVRPLQKFHENLFVTC